MTEAAAMVGRIPHRLRENASSAMPMRLLFVDTETTNAAGDIGPGEQRLRIGAAAFWQRPGTRQPERIERWTFDTAAAFWRRLDRYAVSGKRLVVFAHNAQYDLQVLGGPEALVAAGWQLTRHPVIDRGRTIIKAQRGGAGLLILDSFNFLRGSLDELGQELGYPKWGMPAAHDPDAAWAVYCERDVEVLRRAVGAYLGLCELLDLGYFGQTLPAQALHGYRHRFMPHPIFIHADPVAIALERAAYFGGRCEAWSIGRIAGRFSDFDVNGAYPAAMAAGRFPSALRFTCTPRDVRGLLKKMDGALAVAEVELVTELPLYPKRLADGRLAFPVGRFTTTLATPELEVAIARGAIAEVGRAAVYASAPLFADYVRTLWPIRADCQSSGNFFHARILKDLMNTLFGKFGERRVTWSHEGNEPELQDEVYEVRDFDTKLTTTHRRIGGRLEVREHEAEGDNSFPAISAHVTSAARVNLWQLAERAGIEHVAYLDTDGLTVDEVGAERLRELVNPDELGALKLVRETDDLEVTGAKHIRFGELRLVKGRKRNAQDNGNGTFTQLEFLGIGAALRAGHHGGPLIRTVTKRTPAPRPLGTLGAGGRVLPVRLP